MSPICSRSADICWRSADSGWCPCVALWALGVCTRPMSLRAFRSRYRRATPGIKEWEKWKWATWRSATWKGRLKEVGDLKKSVLTNSLGKSAMADISNRNRIASNEAPQSYRSFFHALRSAHNHLFGHRCLQHIFIIAPGVRVAVAQHKPMP